MHRKKHILIAIALLLLVIAVFLVVDFVQYRTGKNDASRVAASVAQLSPTKDLITEGNDAQCYGRKVLISVQFYCNVSVVKSYQFDEDKTEKTMNIFSAFEKAGWATRGNIKESFFNNPASLSTPTCATLYNDSLYPNDSVRVRICLDEQDASVVNTTIYSSYEPSLVMRKYIGDKAKKQIQ